MTTLVYTETVDELLRISMRSNVLRVNSLVTQDQALVESHRRGMGFLDNTLSGIISAGDIAACLHMSGSMRVIHQPSMSGVVYTMSIYCASHAIRSKGL